VLSGDWVHSKSARAVEHCLFDNERNRFVVETLNPIYIGNKRTALKTDFKKDIFTNGGLIELDQLDIFFQDRYINSHSLNSSQLNDSSEFQIFSVLTQSRTDQGLFSIRNYKLIFSLDPYTTKENACMNVEQLSTIEGIRAENADGLSVIILNDGEVALINE